MTSPGKSILKLAAVALVGCLPATALADSHAGGYEIKNLDDLEFVPMQEGSPLRISVLWGDPATGPVGFLLRIPAGMEMPMHTHTADYRTIVIDGSARHWIEGEDKSAVAPIGKGGYWRQPADQVHGDANAGDGEALALVIFDGPVDFIPAD